MLHVQHASEADHVNLREIPFVGYWWSELKSFTELTIPPEWNSIT